MPKSLLLKVLSLVNVVTDTFVPVAMWLRVQKPTQLDTRNFFIFSTVLDVSGT
jgi:hypothetical protein